MIKIALFGCNGRMGKAISELCPFRHNLKIVCGIDKNTKKSFDYPIFTDIFEFQGDFDVIIDFSSPNSLENMLNFAVSHKKPVVLCTTGHTKEQNEIVLEKSSNIPIFKSGNMSIGINLMINLLEKCVGVLGNTFDIEILEKHHNTKLDSPSGTALMLADKIKSVRNTESQYIYDRTSKMQKRKKREIGISALRGGTTIGEHSVFFLGHDEIIEIKHSAGSKEVFASGALDACIFIKNCTETGMYNMSDLIYSK